ncbi:S8 family serine peptidase [Paraburkholderia gardini]|uniref:S8 family serine peptidase n=1 Tax=Paraburkholderia gardini TaxID=2823469 RepID=UPI002B4B9CDE|nr:S8 family serine peptidase [Paraburkholderia gardini]
MWHVRQTVLWRSRGRETGLSYAPGRDILTLTPGGHYDFVTGSSFAAANVTGTIALLLGLQPDLDAHSIEALLDQTSGPSRQHVRVINACRALDALHHPGVADNTP